MIRTTTTAATTTKKGPGDGKISQKLRHPNKPGALTEKPAA